MRRRVLCDRMLPRCHSSAALGVSQTESGEHATSIEQHHVLLYVIRTIKQEDAYRSVRVVILEDDYSQNWVPAVASLQSLLTALLDTINNQA